MIASAIISDQVKNLQSDGETTHLRDICGATFQDASRQDAPCQQVLAAGIRTRALLARFIRLDSRNILVSRQSARVTGFAAAMAEATPFLPGLSPGATKPLTASRDAGNLSSNGGFVMLREAARRLDLAAVIA